MDDSATNSDEFFNNVPVGTICSATSVGDDTETQGAVELCASVGEISEKVTGSPANNSGSDKIMNSSSCEANLVVAVETRGETTGEAPDHSRQMNNPNETERGAVQAGQVDNHSGTEEDTTQSYLQASENSGGTSEVSVTNDGLNINFSDRSDSSGQGESHAEEANELESTSTAMDVQEDSDTLTGHEENTESVKLASQQGQQALESIYHIKWIKWKGINTPIITQNENGPCPLLAVVNVLLLQRRINIPILQEIVTSGQLMEYIGDCILEEAPKRLSEGARLNYEQNMHDAIAIMNKLQTGLDVNVKFTGVSDFEFTPECIVFDLLSIGLYHGWLVDPQNAEMLSAVGGLSYNQLVEKIIASKQDGAESQLVSEGLTGEAFLEETASQLTYHGLCELNSRLQDDQLGVFFRNNHFSTFHKHKDELFLLVTDQGFLTEERVIWESLANVEGDSYFVDADFRTLPVVQSPPQPTHVPLDPQLSQEDQDYLVALSLQEEQNEAAREPQTQLYPGAAFETPPTQAPSQKTAQTAQEWSDLQLAKQLQEEERIQQQQQQQIQQQRQTQQAHGSTMRTSSPPSQSQGQQRQQRPEDKCTIL